jgi:hypothetical protein
MDVLWLDIEHTDGKRCFTSPPPSMRTPADTPTGPPSSCWRAPHGTPPPRLAGKRYFTWDPSKFGDALSMQAELARTGRQMVNHPAPAPPALPNPHPHLSDSHLAPSPRKVYHAP